MQWHSTRFSQFNERILTRTGQFQLQPICSDLHLPNETITLPSYLCAIWGVNVDQRVLRRLHWGIWVPISCINDLLLPAVHLIATVHYLGHCAAFKMHLQHSKRRLWTTCSIITLISPAELNEVQSTQSFQQIKKQQLWCTEFPELMNVWITCQDA